MLYTTLEQDDVTWLAFAAGIATGAGNAQAQSSLYGIISRIQELPDDGLVPEDTEVVDEVDMEIVPEDFEGSLDPQFMPAPPTPPSRPQDEFGPGPITGLG